MKTIDIFYSKDESKAFILFYCAQIDLNLSREELAYIKSKTNLKNITKICIEICRSNDYQIIQRIHLLVLKYWRMEDERNHLLNEIKALFLSDGEFNQMERNLYRGLRQLFTS